ncbi:MAG TPA: DegT/DnrJ/EryC1/StrS family aminotransferase [Candidatus Pacearchaeota archaeon]|nr:DegT/DnrJ/EryC1/StrS family aminotransferase [Candidatus Pacearchaeota archaeon]
MIPFGDLSREYNELSYELEKAIKAVCQKGWFILGKKVEEFESLFARYIDDDIYAIGVGSGTEALHLSLVAAGVKHGDYVITVPNTAVPTVSAISFAGAKPLFVDVDPNSYNIDPMQLSSTIIKEKKRLGKRLKAVIPVHLYGQSADMDPILDIAKEFDLKVIEDACQAHGAEYKGHKVGSLGDYAAFSFYPSKNLGAYGDGGIILTRNPAEAKKLKMLRNYGQEKRYYHKIKGFNSRLDELQAAILLVKIKYLDKWNNRRREIANMYSQRIKNPSVIKHSQMIYGKHVYHLYVIRHPDRDGLKDYLEEKGIKTLIHYPIPIHLQEAYMDLGYTSGSFPVSEQIAEEILSLPIFPYLSNEEVNTIIDLVNEYE